MWRAHERLVLSSVDLHPDAGEQAVKAGERALALKIITGGQLRPLPWRGALCGAVAGFGAARADRDAESPRAAGGRCSEVKGEAPAEGGRRRT